MLFKKQALQDGPLIAHWLQRGSAGALRILRFSLTVQQLDSQKTTVGDVFVFLSSVTDRCARLLICGEGFADLATMSRWSELSSPAGVGFVCLSLVADTHVD